MLQLTVCMRGLSLSSHDFKCRFLRSAVCHKVVVGGGLRLQLLDQSVQLGESVRPLHPGEEEDYLSV